MTHSEIRDSFGFALAETTQMWRLALDRRLRPTGLSQATWRALFHLARRGDGLTQRALAESIGIEGPSLVRLLDNLEESGMVERRASPTDRRCKLLFLTDQARAMVTEIRSTTADVRAELLAGLSEEQLLAASQVLRQIATNAERLKNGTSE
jgi:MarR family transcriptional regulator for hemolysin